MHVEGCGWGVAAIADAKQAPRRRACLEYEEAPAPVCGHVAVQHLQAKVQQHACDVAAQTGGIGAADSHLTLSLIIDAKDWPVGAGADCMQPAEQLCTEQGSAASEACLHVSHSLRSPHLMSTVSSSESLGTSRVPLFWAVGDATILQVR